MKKKKSNNRNDLKFLLSNVIVNIHISTENPIFSYSIIVLTNYLPNFIFVGMMTMGFFFIKKKRPTIQYPLCVCVCVNVTIVGFTLSQISQQKKKSENFFFVFYLFKFRLMYYVKPPMISFCFCLPFPFSL